MMTEISAKVPDNGSIAAIGVTRATPAMPKTRPHSSTLLALSVVLSSCAGHPKGVMTPIAISAQSPTASKVDMLVATSRLASDNPATLFGGERSPKPSLTDITISIPADSTRKAGDVQWPKHLPPNPKTDFAVTSVKPMTTVQEGFAWFKQHGNGGHALVFIHGFNNTYEDAVFRYAQIVHDSGAQVTPIMFTWPSRARLRDYVYDKESTNYSRTALENTLRYLSKDPDVKDITVLAHSMGTWLAMESLRQMAIRDGKVDAKIDNVILASPDIDVDVFARQFTELGDHRPKFTIFVSQDDRALAASRMISGGVIRVGAINPAAEPYKSKLERAGITVIDLTKVKTDDSMNHGKFAESPEIVQLIGRRLVKGQTLTGTEVGALQGVTAVVAGTAMTINNAATNVITAPSDAIAAPREKRPTDDQKLDGILKSGAAPSGMTN
jgi:esterase/lipase superfamily enzyme